MSNETTSTTYATQELSYVLNQSVLDANIAKVVALGLINEDDINGQPSNVFKTPVYSDLSAASAGTEGTAISTNTALSLGTALSATVTEAALIRGQVTDRAVELKFPGMANAEVLMQQGSFEQKVAALGEEFRRLGISCVEKAENDVLALLASHTNSVGTSGASFTVNNALTALFTLKTLEPLNENFAFLITPKQSHQLKLELGVTGGGLGGGVWAGPADASFFNRRPDMPRNGYQGTFIGIPVYEESNSLVPTANSGADGVGALLCIGSGPVRNEYGSIGAIGIVRRGGLKLRMRYDPDFRGMLIVVASEHNAYQVRDTHGVKIVTVV